MHPRLRAAMGLAAGVAAATAGALAFLDSPYRWVFPLWALGAVVWAAIARRAVTRAVAVNVAAATLALSSAEFYCWSQRPAPDPARYAGGYTEDYFQGDDLLGYRPAPGVRVDARKYMGDELVYDVVYSIDADGLRRAPPARRATPDCVLFFGGSVTFGDGVEDEQTMPYRVGVRTAGGYRVLNYAFHGYGPHHMLARLEQAPLPGSRGCRAPVGIYQAITAHVARSAGLAFWDRHGPRYRLADDGAPARDGNFDSDAPRPIARVLRLERCWLARRLWGPERALRAADFELYLAIVERARSRFEARFPGGRFHVLLWGQAGEPHYDAMYQGLGRRGLSVHAVAQALPDYVRDPGRYALSRHDAHPNPEAHDRIAAFVTQEILAEPRETERIAKTLGAAAQKEIHVESFDPTRSPTR